MVNFPTRMTHLYNFRNFKFKQSMILKFHQCRYLQQKKRTHNYINCNNFLCTDQSLRLRRKDQGNHDLVENLENGRDRSTLGFYNSFRCITVTTGKEHNKHL